MYACMHACMMYVCISTYNLHIHTHTHTHTQTQTQTDAQTHRHRQTHRHTHLKALAGVGMDGGGVIFIGVDHGCMAFQDSQKSAYIDFTGQIH